MPKKLEIPRAWLSTDGTLAANSDSLIPTQKAVKTYIGSAVVTPEIIVGEVGYLTLAAAVTAIGATEATLVVPPGTHVGGGVTIPVTLSLQVLKGATITVATGLTFACNGHFTAGDYQVFSLTGTGTVTFATQSTFLYSSWFADGDTTGAIVWATNKFPCWVKADKSTVVYMGNVGFGTVPGAKLDVAGNFKLNTGLITSDAVGNVCYGADISASANFAASVTAIGSTQAKLITIRGNHVSGGVTIPTTLTFALQQGANHTVANGTTFTINGPFEAGDYQVFSLTGTGAVAGLKLSKPEWFATNTTPGTTDMTAAWNTAMASLSAGGQLVCLPGTAYMVDGAGVLDGDGNYYTIKNTTNKIKIVGNQATLVWDEGTDNTIIILGLEGTDVEVENLNFTMSGWAAAITSSHYAILTSGARSKVIGCTFSDSILHAVPIRNNGANSLVSKCYFYRTAGCVMNVGAYSKTEDCYAEDWKDAGFALNTTTSIGGQLLNLQGSSTYNTHYPFLSIEEGASNWIIKGCDIYNRYGMTLQAFYNTAPANVKGGIISNNIFRTGEGQTADAIHNVQISKYYTDNIIENNKIIGIPGTTNTSAALVVPLNNSKVNNNLIESATVAAGITQLVKWVEVNSGAYLDFTNNTFTIPASVGRCVYGATGTTGNIVRFNNNKYYGAGTGIDVADVPLLSVSLGGDDFNSLTAPTTGLRTDYFFATNKAYRHLYSLNGLRLVSGQGGLTCHAGAVPSAVTHAGVTFYYGDILWNLVPTVGQPMGWGCSSQGTFSSATDSTGDTNGSTAVITGLTDTSDFIVGGFVTVSAGFPSASDPYRLTAKDATSVTLETVSTSVQSNVTVAHVAPVFRVMPNY